jgi:peptidoglycan/LPS O-acetylase OafA/YrhL
MSFFDPLFAVGALCVVVLASFVLGMLRAETPQAGKYGAIDGLRGYLAFFVFVHHAMVWHFFLLTGEWTTPPSNIYTHLGQTSVAFFFMITGFLFYGKIIDNGTKSMEWQKFFVARVLRLGPLYVAVLLLVTTIVAFESGFARVDSVGYLFKCVARWLLFTIPGAPDINGVSTARIVAGVNWSLPYEWYFYLAMPILVFARRVQVPWQYMLMGIGSLSFAFTTGASLYFMLVFGGGIVAAYAVRSKPFSEFAKTPTASVLVILCVGTVVIFFSTAYGYLQLAVLTVAFALIASGANLFGMLRARVSRILGELSYSIYLLHGIMLFVLLKYVVGYGYARTMSAWSYWGMVYAAVPVLLLVASGAFKLIEAPVVIARLRAVRFGLFVEVPDDPLNSADPNRRDYIE